MRIAAVLEDFNVPILADNAFSATKLLYQEILSDIRVKTGADLILVVMAGDFLEDSFPAAEEKYQRAQAIQRLGADLVLELPVSVCLSDPETKAFSGLSMLKRLRSVDDLVIVCRHDDGKWLSELADLLLRSSSKYQAELKKQLKKETNFFMAQTQAIAKLCPEAVELLSDPVNQRALELLKARHQLYWMIQPVFLDIGTLEEHICQEHPECALAFGNQTIKGKEKVLTQKQNLTFGIELCDLLKRPAESLKRRLEETPGGGPELLERLWKQRNLLQDKKEFEKIVKSFPSKTLSEDSIRAFLMKALIGIQRGNLIICGLRANCPYSRILSGTEDVKEALRYIQEKSWVPLLLEPVYGEGKKERQEQLDECGQMLAVLDDKAHELYLRAKE